MISSVPERVSTEARILIEYVTTNVHRLPFHDEQRWDAQRCDNFANTSIATFGQKELANWVFGVCICTKAKYAVVSRGEPRLGRSWSRIH